MNRIERLNQYTERLSYLQSVDHVEGVDSFHAEMVQVFTKLAPNWTPERINGAAAMMAVHERPTLRGSN